MQSHGDYMGHWWMKSPNGVRRLDCTESAAKA